MAEVKTVSQLKAELKAEVLAELDARLKKLEAGYSELKDSLAKVTKVAHEHGKLTERKS